jgi:exodeoxyribonuclease-3
MWPRFVAAIIRAGVSPPLGQRCVNSREVGGPVRGPELTTATFSMRIITLNVNGIRAAERKGFAHWLARGNPWDVVCLQEIKATPTEIPRPLHAPRRAYAAFHPAERKGYSGVALYAAAAPRFVTGFGSREFDAEGRYLEAHFAELTVISLYLPSGSSGAHRQASKFRFLAEFLPHLAKLRKAGREIILCGDWNIAHREIDLKNWRSNRKNSGFLPEERAWLDRVLRDGGWLDSYRTLKPEGEDYTWWSNRGQARAKNVGWRIDYQLASPNLRQSLRECSIYRKRWFSDHAPYIVDYEFADPSPGGRR